MKPEQNPPLPHVPELFESDAKLSELQALTNQRFANFERIYAHAKKARLVFTEEKPEDEYDPGYKREVIQVYDVYTDITYRIQLEGELKSSSAKLTYSIIHGAPGFFHGVVSGSISRRFRGKLFQQLADYLTDLVHEPSIKQVPITFKRIVSMRFVNEMEVHLAIAQTVEDMVDNYVEWRYMHVQLSDAKEAYK